MPDFMDKHNKKRSLPLEQQLKKMEERKSRKRVRQEEDDEWTPAKIAKKMPQLVKRKSERGEVEPFLIDIIKTLYESSRSYLYWSAMSYTFQYLLMCYEH